MTETEQELQKIEQEVKQIKEQILKIDAVTKDLEEKDDKEWIKLWADNLGATFDSKKKLMDAAPEKVNDLALDLLNDWIKNKKGKLPPNSAKTPKSQKQLELYKLKDQKGKLVDRWDAFDKRTLVLSDPDFAVLFEKGEKGGDDEKTIEKEIAAAGVEQEKKEKADNAAILKKVAVSNAETVARAKYIDIVKALIERVNDAEEDNLIGLYDKLRYTGISLLDCVVTLGKLVDANKRNITTEHIDCLLAFGLANLASQKVDKVAAANKDPTFKEAMTYLSIKLSETKTSAKDITFGRLLRIFEEKCVKVVNASKDTIIKTYYNPANFDQSPADTYLPFLFHPHFIGYNMNIIEIARIGGYILGLRAKGWPNKEKGQIKLKSQLELWKNQTGAIDMVTIKNTYDAHCPEDRKDWFEQKSVNFAPKSLSAVPELSAETLVKVKASVESIFN